MKEITFSRCSTDLMNAKRQTRNAKRQTLNDKRETLNGKQ